MKNNENLFELKKKYLFDEDTGTIRRGLTSMMKYMEILTAEDEDEVNEIINGLVDDNIENLDFIDLDDVDEQE